MYFVTAIGETMGTTACSPTAPSRPTSSRVRVRGRRARWRSRGPLIDWVADHRKHMPTPMRRETPILPTSVTAAVSPGSGTPTSAGSFDSNGQADRRKYAPDLMDDRGMRLLTRRFVRARRGLLAGDPGRARLAADRNARRRTHRTALGRARADLLRPPHHVVDQLDLPLPRPPPLRRRRMSTNVWWLSLASLGRILAPQPSRLPALGRPRPAPLGARPRRGRSSARCSA